LVASGGFHDLVAPGCLDNVVTAGRVDHLVAPGCLDNLVASAGLDNLVLNWGFLNEGVAVSLFYLVTLEGADCRMRERDSTSMVT